MIVRALKLRRYRGIQELDIEFHNQVNVLVGANGSGKSSILYSIVILLYFLYFPMARNQSSKHKPALTALDISNKYDDASMETTVANKPAEEYSWGISIKRNQEEPEKITFDQREKLAGSFNRNGGSENSSSPPAFAYYSTNRIVSDIPERIRNRHQFDTPQATYAEAFSRDISFRLFFEWFREREDLVNERLLENRDFIDPQFKSVSEAIARLTGFHKLRIRRAPQRMLLEKNGQTLEISQLSDGEKCLMAMVGDMAMRLAIANPTMEKPLNGKAIFLIDEIDLHLHPAWQRLIIPRLMEIFPHSQFIVSTHSTQVLTHIAPESILLLRNSGGEITLDRPIASYGQTQDRLHEDLMEVPIRPDQVIAQFDALHDAITAGDTSTARKKLNELRLQIGSDPELVTAGILIKRREMNS